MDYSPKTILDEEYLSDKPLTEQVADRIKQLIIQQELHSGDKLPTETALAERMGVSRSTIREAIKSLVSQNVLRARHGAGTYIADSPGMADDPLGFQFIQDKQHLARDLLEVRAMIEPEVAAMAASHATQDDIRELEELYGKMERLLLSGEDYLEVDIMFHQKIAEASRNMVVPRLTPIITEAVNLFTTRTEYQLLQETLDTHKGVLEAIKSHDPIWARDAMILHLAYNRNALREIERRERGLPVLAPKVPEEILHRKLFHNK